MSKARILIVEDERIIAADLENKLLDMGYDVCGRVSTGEEAVEIAERERPDLVIMDVKLEGKMDGVEAAGLMRERLRLPVVFLTAFSDDFILEKAKRTEPFGYLIKPFQPRELHSTIEITLYKSEMDEKLRRTKEALEKALAEVKILRGILPICAKCKKIRDDRGYWNQIEFYIQQHSEADFTHSICPDCRKELYPELYEEE